MGRVGDGRPFVKGTEVTIAYFSDPTLLLTVFIADVDTLASTDDG